MEKRYWLAAVVSGIFATSYIGPAAAGSVELPGGGTVKSVNFERHVMGLFSKMGCNAGSCHGSFQGKNGFRLSLFGYNADKDFTALTRDNLGRRIDPVNPDRSLLLLKATGQTLHEGGARFAKDSWQYQIFRRWIDSGAERVPSGGDVASLTSSPAELLFRKPGESGQLQVVATFADGARENVTPFCEFRVQDDAVADVSPSGAMTALRP